MKASQLLNVRVRSSLRAILMGFIALVINLNNTVTFAQDAPQVPSAPAVQGPVKPEIKSFEEWVTWQNAEDIWYHDRGLRYKGLEEAVGAPDFGPGITIARKFAKVLPPKLGVDLDYPLDWSFSLSGSGYVKGSKQLTWNELVGYSVTWFFTMHGSHREDMKERGLNQPPTARYSMTSYYYDLAGSVLTPTPTEDTLPWKKTYNNVVFQNKFMSWVMPLLKDVWKAMEPTDRHLFRSMIKDARSYLASFNLEAESSHLAKLADKKYFLIQNPKGELRKNGLIETFIYRRIANGDMTRDRCGDLVEKFGDYLERWDEPGDATTDAKAYRLACIKAQPAPLAEQP
jgi:hypothetical protein